VGKKNFNYEVRDFTEDELALFRKQIGRNVANIRKSKGFSQLDLSHIMGYSSVSLVSGAEIGFNNTKFSIDHLYKISKVLNVDICEFFKQSEVE
jgi:transcriptional regulator with XRE-family HTH domain